LLSKYNSSILAVSDYEIYIFLGFVFNDKFLYLEFSHKPSENPESNTNSTFSEIVSSNSFFISTRFTSNAIEGEVTEPARLPV